ncbi:unnamed protein product [Camellia sinensis]
MQSCNDHHCQNQQRLPLGKPSSVLRFYTPGGLLHHHECNDYTDEVIGSVDTDELAKYFSFKSDPEDEGAEKMKKKMETARDQLAEALYQKGLAMAEIESMKTVGNQSKTRSPYYLGQWLDAGCHRPTEQTGFDRHSLEADMGMEIEGDGRARISSTRSGSRSRLASCTSWQSRQPGNDTYRRGLTTLVDMPLNSFPSTVSKDTFELKCGMDLIAVIRASGRISHARGLNVPSSGIVGEQFIEKIRRVREGWRLPDMMFATKCSLSDACNTIAKQLENVYSSIALETTKFLYGCTVNSYILNVNWLIHSVAAGYALPRDKSDKINLDIQRVVGYRQWCNKLWNAVRFAMSKLGDNYTPPTNVVPDIMPFNCQWILSVLNKAISKTVTSLDSYEFSDAATVVYSWWQFQLCDVFIEAAKPYFASDAQAFAFERSYAQDTLSCWTNEKVEYEMDMIESAVKSLRSLRALMPAKERHESKLVLVTLLWLLECIFREKYSNRYSFIMPGALHHYYFDGCEAWHGRAQGFFDWLSRQLSGLSNFPVAVNLNYVLLLPVGCY